MPSPELDERFDQLVLELRATRLAAPGELRERVRALAAEAQPAPVRKRRRLALPVRRVALVALPAIVVLAAAGALVGGLVTSGGGGKRALPGAPRERIVVGGAAAPETAA